MIDTYLSIVLALGLAILLSFSFRNWNTNAPLPPGPPTQFIGGNLHQLPKAQPWKRFTEWSKEYGPVFSLRIVRNRMIVLSSLKAVSDLLESRSAIYSDRPRAMMMGELAGRAKSMFITSSLDPRFKPLRKMLHSGLNPRAAQTYRPIQLAETRVLLNNLAVNPENFIAHIRRNAGALILKVAYGYQVETDNDEWVKMIEDAFVLVAGVSIPGRFYVEIFPILKYVPKWFPGAGFKRKAEEIAETLRSVNQVPFDWVKTQMINGTNEESFVSMHLGSDAGRNLSADEEEIIITSSAALYIGGADTTVSALTTFVLLMTLYPEVQKRAQAEVDAVTSGRLPTFDDLAALPYITAMIKEIIRWAPVAPLVHGVTRDDNYNGFTIPKGSRVVANIWAIAHDEELYPNPFTFNPERHLGETPQTDPFKFVFGFGRRVCPGAHLAELSLFLNITSILATFTIAKALDANKQEIEPPVDWTSGTVSHVKPFPCRFIPRSKDIMSSLDGS
ncbi:cytochrome P450 [Crucibulum laeve]|uniref:Cytochrome P450 n=1 Tax=Crucibulum laeve TaxID=68775 RepID=A0A5C3LXW6_9AGAR|nr:cytochrome P450 [Crucibulum laeve]